MFWVSRRFVISCERCENLPFRKLPVVCVTSQRLVAIKRGFHKKTQFTPDKKCEENPRAIPISQVKRVKRETAPTSDSAQFILAWRSEDSIEKRK